MSARRWNISANGDPPTSSLQSLSLLPILPSQRPRTVAVSALAGAPTPWCVVVFDIETTEGIKKGVSFDRMSPSVVCALRTDTLQELTLWPSGGPGHGEMERLFKWFDEARVIVAHNGLSFDMRVLKPLYGNSVEDEVRFLSHCCKMFDTLVQLYIETGNRVGLQAILVANNRSKTAKGTEAVKMWEKKQFADLEEYCKEDVKQLYEVSKMDEVKLSTGGTTGVISFERAVRASIGKQDYPTEDPRGFAQRSEKWYDARKGKVTASIAGGLLNLKGHHYRKQALNAMITGDGEQVVPTSHMYVGSALEEVARYLFQHHTGLMVRDAGLYVHDTHTQLAASPDGVVFVGHYTDEGMGIIEIKVSTSGIPTLDESYLLQCQLQLACTRSKRLYFVAMDAKTFRMEIHDVVYNETHTPTLVRMCLDARENALTGVFDVRTKDDATRLLKNIKGESVSYCHMIYEPPEFVSLINVDRLVEEVGRRKISSLSQFFTDRRPLASTAFHAPLPSPPPSSTAPSTSSSSHTPRPGYLCDRRTERSRSPRPPAAASAPIRAGPRRVVEMAEEAREAREAQRDKQPFISVIFCCAPEDEEKSPPVIGVANATIDNFVRQGWSAPFVLYIGVNKDYTDTSFLEDEYVMPLVSNNVIAYDVDKELSKFSKYHGINRGKPWIERRLTRLDLKATPIDFDDLTTLNLLSSVSKDTSGNVEGMVTYVQDRLNTTLDLLLMGSIEGLLAKDGARIPKEYYRKVGMIQIVDQEEEHEEMDFGKEGHAEEHEEMDFGNEDHARPEDTASRNVAKSNILDGLFSESSATLEDDARIQERTDVQEDNSVEDKSAQDGQKGMTNVAMEESPPVGAEERQRASEAGGSTSSDGAMGAVPTTGADALADGSAAGGSTSAEGSAYTEATYTNFVIPNDPADKSMPRIVGRSTEYDDYPNDTDKVHYYLVCTPAKGKHRRQTKASTFAWYTESSVLNDTKLREAFDLLPEYLQGNDPYGNGWAVRIESARTNTDKVRLYKVLWHVWAEGKSANKRYEERERGHFVNKNLPDEFERKQRQDGEFEEDDSDTEHAHAPAMFAESQVQTGPDRTATAPSSFRWDTSTGSPRLSLRAAVRNHTATSWTIDALKEYTHTRIFVLRSRVPPANEEDGGPSETELQQMGKDLLYVRGAKHKAKYKRALAAAEARRKAKQADRCEEEDCEEEDEGDEGDDGDEAKALEEWETKEAEKFIKEAVNRWAAHRAAVDKQIKELEYQLEALNFIDNSRSTLPRYQSVDGLSASPRVKEILQKWVDEEYSLKWPAVFASPRLILPDIRDFLSDNRSKDSERWLKLQREVHTQKALEEEKEPIYGSAYGSTWPDGPSIPTATEAPGDHVVPLEWFSPSTEIVMESKRPAQNIVNITICLLTENSEKGSLPLGIFRNPSEGLSKYIYSPAGLSEKKMNMLAKTTAYTFLSYPCISNVKSKKGQAAMSRSSGVATYARAFATNPKFRSMIRERATPWERRIQLLNLGMPWQTGNPLVLYKNVFTPELDSLLLNRFQGTDSLLCLCDEAIQNSIIMAPK